MLSIFETVVFFKARRQLSGKIICVFMHSKFWNIAARTRHLVNQYLRPGFLSINKGTYRCHPGTIMHGIYVHTCVWCRFCSRLKSFFAGFGRTWTKLHERNVEDCLHLLSRIVWRYLRRFYRVEIRTHRPDLRLLMPHWFSLVILLYIAPVVLFVTVADMAAY